MFTYSVGLNDIGEYAIEGHDNDGDSVVVVTLSKPHGQREHLEHVERVENLEENKRGNTLQRNFNVITTIHYPPKIQIKIYN